MQRQTLLLFIATIVVFFLLIGAAIVTIMVMPPDIPEDDISLKRYYENTRKRIASTIKDLKFVNMSEYITNYTDPVPEINEVLAKNHHVLFPAKFIHDLAGKIIIPSNRIIKFEDNAKYFVSYPSLLPSDPKCAFSMEGTNNITIIGNNATIYHIKLNLGEEDYHTICATGASDVLIMDLDLVEPMGYGIVVSGSETSNCSKNIDICNVKIEKATNGGLIVESVKALKAYQLSVKGSIGRGSENGVTIAAKSKNDTLWDIQIQDLHTEENKGVGLYIMPGIFLKEFFNMTLKSYESRYDGEFASIYIRNSPEKGKLTLKDLHLAHKEGFSAIIRTWDTTKCETDVFRPRINNDHKFEWVIKDQEGDPFESNIEKLYVKT